jgi:hypothetical protein
MSSSARRVMAWPPPPRPLRRGSTTALRR